MTKRGSCATSCAGAAIDPTIRVRSVTEGNRSFVEWSSHWDAKDDAASAFCHGIDVALLTDLQTAFA